MKKIGTLSLTGVLSLMLIGCSAEEEQGTEGTVVQEEGTVVEEESGTENANVEQNDNKSNQEGMLAKMDELEYAEFELEVEYAGDTEYEVEIEQKNVGGVSAKIEDSLNHVVKNGTEAFDELHPLVQQLTITQETNKDEAISDVLSTFNLPTDYTKFDLELTFNDGTNVEVEDRNN